MNFVQALAQGDFVSRVFHVLAYTCKKNLYMAHNIGMYKNNGKGKIDRRVESYSNIFPYSI